MEVQYDFEPPQVDVYKQGTECDLIPLPDGTKILRLERVPIPPQYLLMALNNYRLRAEWLECLPTDVLVPRIHTIVVTSDSRVGAIIDKLPGHGLYEALSCTVPEQGFAQWRQNLETYTHASDTAVRTLIRDRDTILMYELILDTHHPTNILFDGTRFYHVDIGVQQGHRPHAVSLLPQLIGWQFFTSYREQGILEATDTEMIFGMYQRLLKYGDVACPEFERL